MYYKNIAIIGSNGFIGRNLAQKLMEIPDVNLHLYSRGKESVLNNQIPYTSLDLVNETDFEKHFRDTDLIYYLASETIPSTSWGNPTLEIKNNLLPFIHFLETVVQLNLKKIVFVSSAGTVYGVAEHKVTENSYKNPFNPYGITKLTMEYFLNYFNIKNNLQFDVYRASNVYGDGQNTQKGLGIINTFLEKIITTHQINIFGDGENIRNYLYVNDLANALASSLDAAPLQSNIFNVSSNDTLSINELVAKIKNIVTEQFEVIYTPKRQSDNSVIYLDNRKILSALPGFEFTTLEEGILKTYQHLKKLLPL